MTQKIVSFEVAEYIKKAGYPQEGDWWYTQDGDDLSDCLMPNYQGFYAPTYLDVWLWLWREKGLRLSVEYTRATETEYESWCTLNQEHLCNLPVSNGDAEEAIEKSIKYIIDNDLIK